MKTNVFVVATALFLALPLTSWSHGQGESGINILQEGDIAPHFTLIDQNKRNISIRDFKGRPVFITFIYTHCPDVCPLILQNRKAMQESFEKGMGEKGLVFLAITVDPEVDTPEVLKNYANKLEMDERDLHLLTGDSEIVKNVLHDYGIVAEKDEKSGLVGHTLLGYTITSEGKVDKSILFTVPGS